MTNARHKAKAFLLTAIAFLACCQNGRRIGLVDTLGGTIDGKHLTNHFDPRLEAPIIIVGLVERNDVVRKHLQAARYPGVYLDLHEVRCKLENVLQGTINGSELKFFYYAQGGSWNPRYKRLFQADPTRRYFFFLTWEVDKFRSIGDVGEFSVLVESGTHESNYSTEQDIGRRMSELLLTPGKGVDTAKMAAWLSSHAEIADVWGSRALSVQLLRDLFSRGEPLRSSACGTLVSNYHGQDDCLLTVAMDSGVPEQRRQWAVKALEEKKEEEQRVLEDLKDPAQLGFQDYAGDSRHRLREEFETLLFNPDPVFHERACTALKRYFPWDTEPRCSEAAVTKKGGRSHR